MVIALPDDIAVQLRAVAVANGVSAATFASALLRTVVKDDLFEVALDESS